MAAILRTNSNFDEEFIEMFNAQYTPQVFGLMIFFYMYEREIRFNFLRKK